MYEPILPYNEPIQAPDAIGRLIDEVMAEDRRYFAEHPGETERLRTYVPGELWPFEPPEDAPIVILVQQIDPSARSRTPIFVESIAMIPDDSDRRLPL